jgi:DMSO/TMAO reductase YedYZ molybdopterin-dependent catalytic subunit
MPPISRGFRRRGAVEGDASRMPPGQYLTKDFPVLSAGPTPRIALDQWSLTLDGAIDRARRWSWSARA